MSSTTSLPPETADDKKPYSEAPPKPLAEVSEALNGLRELASRVTPATSKPSIAMLDIGLPQEQLDFALLSSEPNAPAVVIPAEEPRAQVIETAAPAPEDFSGPEPVISAKPARPPRVGETLRDARLSAGFSLDEVADEIKIKPAYLHAIEEGRYGDLPSRTYAVGWVRSYAQALGLHTEELVARCRGEVGALPRTTTPLVMREPVADRRLPGGALMTLCVVLAVITYAVSYGFLRPAATSSMPYTPPAPEVTATAPAAPPAPALSEAGPAKAPVASEISPASAPVAEAKTAAPVKSQAREALKEISAPAAEAKDEGVNDAAALPPARIIEGRGARPVTAARPQVIPGAAPEDVAAMQTPPAPAASGTSPATPAVKAPVKVKPPSRIRLHATNDTSVRIIDAQGQVLAERTIRKGESFYVPDHQHYTLSTSNAGALRVAVDGRDMPVLGDTGEAMHNIPLDPSDLLQVLAQ